MSATHAGEFDRSQTCLRSCERVNAEVLCIRAEFWFISPRSTLDIGVSKKFSNEDWSTKNDHTAMTALEGLCGLTEQKSDVLVDNQVC